MSLPYSAASGSKSRPAPPVHVEGAPGTPGVPSGPSVGPAIAEGGSPQPVHTEGAPGTPGVPQQSPAAGVSGHTGPQISMKTAAMRVFDHQPTPLQLSIVQKALKAPTPLGNMILSSLRGESPFKVNPASLPEPVRMLLPTAQVYTSLVARGVKVPGLSSSESPTLKAALAVVFQSQSVQRKQQIEANGQKLGIIPKDGNFFDAITFASDKAANAIAAGLGQFRSSTTPGGGHDIASIQEGPSAGQQAVNAAKDAINLPATTFTSAGIIAQDIASGNLKKAAQDAVGPLEHPLQTFQQHPLDSILMLSGLVHGGTRLAAGAVRPFVSESLASRLPEPGLAETVAWKAARAVSDVGSSVRRSVGKALSTDRQPVHLTANAYEHAPPFSKYPLVKGGQATVEAMHTRVVNGERVPATEPIRARKITNHVYHEIAFRELLRRAERDAVINRRHDMLAPSHAERVGHSITHALAYGPQRALIPGADVLALIADHTIRRPDTIVEDLQKHLKMVEGNRPNLLLDPQALKAHTAYVKEIQAALNDKAFLKNPDPAFKAADAYAKDYAPVEHALHGLGHFGELTKEQLFRRTVAHYAVSHMGAHYDPEAETLTVGGRPLSNEAIRQHMASKNGSGGRPIAYTSDRVSFDRTNKHGYVKSEGLPFPATRRNTLHAYTHGLTRPGHDALTEQHMLAQGLLNAHQSMRSYIEQYVMHRDGGGWYKGYEDAKSHAPPGYVPISVAGPFHPQASINQAYEGLSPSTIEEEAQRHSLLLADRLRSNAPGGRWGLIHESAAKAFQAQEHSISPDTALRAIRAANNQFRSVALSLSAHHLPGVTQEMLIRMASGGVGIRSWLTERSAFKTAEAIDPRGAYLARLRTSRSGTIAGMTERGRTRSSPEVWKDTRFYKPMKAIDVFFKAPGPRQAVFAWHAWRDFMLGTTRHMLEQQVLRAGAGKAMLNQHGYIEAAQIDGLMGLVKRSAGLYGKQLENAARGYLDPNVQRQIVKINERLYGKWDGFGPAGKTTLMFTPFGLWWVNSLRWMARMPVDRPIQAAVLASANVGTEKQRQKMGMNLWGPGHLPAYMQGGFMFGGTDYGQNYYAPQGTLNDPLETAQSLILPEFTPIALAALGVDWKGGKITSAGNPYGHHDPTEGQKVQYMLDSLLGSFVPFYQKAEQIATGGASPYDVTGAGNQWLPPMLRGQAPATKTPGKGFIAGLKKATNPVREYHPKDTSGGGGGPTLPGSTGTIPGSTGSLGRSTGTIPGSTGTLR